MSEFITPISMTRTELLTMLVEKYIHARANQTDTMLGTPEIVARSEGELVGACMVLGLHFEVKDENYVFYTNNKKKKVCTVSMGEYYKLIEYQKKIAIKDQQEFQNYINKL